MSNTELRTRMDAAIAAADRGTMLILCDIAACQAATRKDYGDGPGVYAFTAAYSEIFGEAEI
jgi:hypothetical protein